MEELLRHPAFEVREVVPGGYGRVYRIWADGRTEGFEGRHIVLNRIGVMADHQTAMVMEKTEQDLLARLRIDQCPLGWVGRTVSRFCSWLRGMRRLA